MDTEEVKAWLLSYGELQREIDSQIERIDSLRSAAQAPKTATWSGMPHAPAPSTDKIGDTLALIDQLETETCASIAKAAALRDQIEAAVVQIDHNLAPRAWPDRRAVLRMRYVDLLQWEVIARLLFGSKPDFEERMDTYIRRCHRVHRDAVGDLTMILMKRGKFYD